MWGGFILLESSLYIPKANEVNIPQLRCGVFFFHKVVTLNIKMVSSSRCLYALWGRVLFSSLQPVKFTNKNQVTIREVIPEKWLGIGLVEHLNLSGVHMLMQALEKW